MALELVATETIDWVLEGPLSQALVTTVLAGDVLDIVHVSQGSGGQDMLSPSSPAVSWQDTGKADEGGWAPAIQVWSVAATAAALGNPTVTIPQNGDSRHKADVLIWRGAATPLPASVFAEGFGDDTSGHVTPDVSAAAGDGVIRVAVTRGGPGTYSWPASNPVSNSSAGSGGAGGVSSTAYLLAVAPGAQGTETADPPGDWGEYITCTFVRPAATGGGEPAQGTLNTGLNLAPALSGAARAAGMLNTGLNLVPALSGARTSAGVLGAAIALAPALTGSAPHGGILAGTLDLAPAFAGARASRGAVHAGLGLSPSLAGARASLGALHAGLTLSPALNGARRSLGVLAASLRLQLALTGSDGQAGRAVTPWPAPPEPVDSFPHPSGPAGGFPWPPRPVRSYQEVAE